MRRVIVVGIAGSGKSTLAARLAARLGVPHVELDALYWQDNWSPRPVAEFRDVVELATRDGGWVVDGNYTRAHDVHWPRADTVVFLDYPRHLVMLRIVRRSLWRALARTVLWNGNRERWRNLLSRDPAVSVIAWSWTEHAAKRAQYRALMTDPRWSGLRFVHLTSPRAADRWLAACPASSGEPEADPAC